MEKKDKSTTRVRIRNEDLGELKKTLPFEGTPNADYMHKIVEGFLASGLSVQTEEQTPMQARQLVEMKKEISAMKESLIVVQETVNLNYDKLYGRNESAVQDAKSYQQKEIVQKTRKESKPVTESNSKSGKKEPYISFDENGEMHLRDDLEINYSLFRRLAGDPENLEKFLDFNRKMGMTEDRIENVRDTIIRTPLWDKEY